MQVLVRTRACMQVRVLACGCACARLLGGHIHPSLLSMELMLKKRARPGTASVAPEHGRARATPHQTQLHPDTAAPCTPTHLCLSLHKTADHWA